MKFSWELLLLQNLVHGWNIFNGSCYFFSVVCHSDSIEIECCHSNVCFFAKIEGLGRQRALPSSSCRALGPFGPSWGPCCGPLAPSLRIKIYLYTNIVVTGEITKIAITPSILVELTWNFLCIILKHHSTKWYTRPIVNFCLKIVRNRDRKLQCLKSFLVLFLATKKALVPLANDPILSERSI